MKGLHDVLERLVQLGYPVVAIFASGDEVHAVMAAESDIALRVALAKPEDWEIWRTNDRSRLD